MDLFFFGVYPYICLVIMTLGLGIRYVGTPGEWNARSSNLFAKKSLLTGSFIFHYTIILVFFGHVVGHAGWEHFFGNIMMLLVVGPLLEEKYGSSNILFVILATALVTGVITFIFFPRIQLLGASGVVFAFILLASMTSITEGKIPLTFILVAVIYIGQQVYEGIFVHNNVSNLTHILGGMVGSGLGYVMNKYKMNRY